MLARIGELLRHQARCWAELDQLSSASVLRGFGSDYLAVT